MNPQLESFRYDDAIVRKFLWATFIWGLIGMTVGLLIALPQSPEGRRPDRFPLEPPKANR